MDKTKIWIPNCEHYGGYTDRHVVLSKQNIRKYLNIMNNLVKRSNEYFFKMKNKGNGWNLEQLIKFHLKQTNVLQLVKEFPYVMYSVRSKNGTTRWAKGTYEESLGYCIKYKSEYEKSTYYKKEFNKSKLSIDKFYEKHIWNYNTIKKSLASTNVKSKKKEITALKNTCDNNKTCNLDDVLKNTDDALDDILENTDDALDDILENTDNALDDVLDVSVF
jgi:hypothetical protein